MKKLYTASLFIISFLLFSSALFAQSPIFYGMTLWGGSQQEGAVINFNPANNSENVLFSFSNSLNGAAWGNLTYDPANGLLYGMAGGTIISLNPVTNKEAFCANNVDYSYGSLTYNPDNGLFYGMFGLYQGGIISFNPITNVVNTVWNFGVNPSDGSGTFGSLIYNPANKLFYGMTRGGGSNGGGAIISFNPATNTDSLLWSFGSGTDGSSPFGSLVYDPANGLYYGMTEDGGSTGLITNGTIISFNPATNQEKVVWSFLNPADGTGPMGDLVYNTHNGLFYGMTPSSDGNPGGGSGVIFSFNPTTNTASKLWSFSGSPSDGSLAQGNLVYDSFNGLYYGMAYEGGADSAGTIFSFDPNTNAENVVWNFQKLVDANSPVGSLLAYTPSNRKATITTGAISPLTYCAGSSVSVPYSFSGIVDSGNVFTAQLSDANGVFAPYAIIGSVASTTSGTISATIPANTSSGTKYRIRVVCSNAADSSINNGSNISINALQAVSVSPITICKGTGGLLSANGVTTYTWLPATGLSATTGATVTANPAATTTYTVTGTGTCGSTTATAVVTVNTPPAITLFTSNITSTSFTLNWTVTDSANYSISYSGASTGAVNDIFPPQTITGLTPGGIYSITVTQNSGSCSAIGNTKVATYSTQSPVFYGTTYNGGSNNGGTIISFNPLTNKDSVVWSFGGVKDGVNPGNDLTYHSQDGLFYEPVYHGGMNNDGAVITFNPATGKENVVYSFGSKPDGSQPSGDFVYDKDDSLFYTTMFTGGINGNGTIISFNPRTNRDSTLWSFGSGTDGAYPYDHLTYDPLNGLYYGTTFYGGSVTNRGVIFSFDKTANRESVVWNFQSVSSTDGRTPQAGLTYNTQNGLFYGMTVSGGSNDKGAIFSFNPVTNTDSVLWNLGNGQDGYEPGSDFVYDEINGLYYGTTAKGGANNAGTIISFNPITNRDSVVWSFGSGADGKGGGGDLVYDSANGLYYGMTGLGGSNNKGIVYSFNPTNNAETLLWSFGSGTDGWNPHASFVPYLTNNSISTGNISPLTYCTDASVSVPYTITGTFNAGNVFTAQLSDSTGNFTSAVNIGTLTSTTTGTINVTIPANALHGTGYRIRVISSNPVATGNDNGSNLTINIIPTATIVADKDSICFGSQSIISYKGNADTRANYTWNFSGGTASPGGTVQGPQTITWPVSAKFTVTLTVSEGGCTSSSLGSATVVVGPLPNVTVNALTFCKGTGGTLFASGATTYLWSPATGLSATTGTTVTANPASTITYTVTGINTCGSTSAKAVVTVTQPLTPLVSVTDSPGGAICPGTTIVFAAHPANGGTLPTYQWKLNGTNVGTNIPAYSNSSLTANDSVWVVLTSNATCVTTTKATSNELGFVLKSGTAVSVNSISICSGSSGALNATGATTYTWAPSTGISATTGSTVTVNPASTTTYTVTGTSACGTTTAKAIVTVNQTPVAATATAGTAASTNQLTANWNVTSGATGYYLDVSLHSNFSSFVTGYNNLSVGNVTTKAVTGLTPATTYYYRVKASNTCGTGVNSNIITYATTNCSAITGGTVTPASTIICKATSQTLTLTGASSGTYQWQQSTDNTNWSNVSFGGNGTTYATSDSNGLSNKYYRCITSNACYTVASTSAVVDVSVPNITVTASATTSTGFTVNWSPAGTGNYKISYGGTTSGTVTSVASPYALTGLTSGSPYSVTVTQTTPAGCLASGTLSGITTLCAAPTALKITGTTANSISLSWTGPNGNYRIYYTQLFTSTHVTQTQDVTNATTATLSSLVAGGSYEIYVVSLNCGSASGQASSFVTGTTTTTTTCTTAPVIDSVKTTCSSQVQVWVHGNPANQYKIYVQAISPALQAANAYTISGGNFSVNVAAGQSFLIGTSSICTGGIIGKTTIWPQALIVPPACGSVNNLLLNQPTCVGFNVSWNADNCATSTLTSYLLSLRKQGTISWSSYSVLPTSTFKVVNWLAAATTYQCYIRSAYSCGTYVTYGPSSQTQTITTASQGCRTEEESTPEEVPASVVTAGNSEESFSLYPNPNTGEFMIDFSRINPDEEQVRIEVINVLGQTVLTHITSVSGGHLNEFVTLPNGSASGIYFVRLIAGNRVYNGEMNVSK